MAAPVRVILASIDCRHALWPLMFALKPSDGIEMPVTGPLRTLPDLIRPLDGGSGWSRRAIPKSVYANLSRYCRRVLSNVLMRPSWMRETSTRGNPTSKNQIHPQGSPPCGYSSNSIQLMLEARLRSIARARYVVSAIFPDYQKIHSKAKFGIFPRDQQTFRPRILGYQPRTLRLGRSELLQSGCPQHLLVTGSALATISHSSAPSMPGRVPDGPSHHSDPTDSAC